MSCCHFVMTWADKILEWFHGALFFTTSSAFSVWCESLQSILWVYLSWLICIYTLEKLASGWSPSASPLLDRSHVIGQAGPAGVFELLGGCLIGKWDKRRPLVLESFGGLILWRTFLVIFGGPFPLNEWWHVVNQLALKVSRQRKEPLLVEPPYVIFLKALTLSFKSLTFSVWRSFWQVSLWN